MTPPPGFLQVEPWLRGSGAGSVLSPEFPFRHLSPFSQKNPDAVFLAFFIFAVFHIGVSVPQVSNQDYTSCPLLG